MTTVVGQRDHQSAATSSSRTTLGATIRVLGAGVAGADLVTIIATYISGTQVTVNAPLPGASVTAEGVAYYPQSMKHNIFWDQWYEGIQIYGSGDACSVGSTYEENFWFNNDMFLGGLGEFPHDRFRRSRTTTRGATRMSIGDTMNHMRNFAVQGNYFHDNAAIAVAPGTWDTMSITGNTFIGTADSRPNHQLHEQHVFDLESDRQRRSSSSRTPTRPTGRTSSSTTGRTSRLWTWIFPRQLLLGRLST